MVFANKMTPGVSESIPSRQIFEKKGVERSKNSVFGHFSKIVELNTDMLKPTLLSEIDN